MNLKPERKYFMQGKKKCVAIPLTDPDFYN